MTGGARIPKLRPAELDDEQRTLYDAHWRSDFEQYAHEAVARAAGLTGTELAAIRLFELLALVGYYATLALQLRVFRVPAPGGDSGPRGDSGPGGDRPPA